jgi:hypothetical protein
MSQTENYNSVTSDVMSVKENYIPETSDVMSQFLLIMALGHKH